MLRDPSKFVDNEYDVVVIGGGIYGACIAWDAALRGLSVALIERGDFGQETSANSLKTVHGGLRYLQDLDLNLVRMMVRERSAYLRIAPHLVQPLPCITPTYAKLMKSKIAMGMALKLNDLAGYDRNQFLGSDRKILSSRLFSKKDCQKVLPDLPIDGVTGAALWYDGQIYDTERFTLAFINSAIRAGAEACNYVEAVGLMQKGNEIKGVKARDVITKDKLEIRSKVVVNAAGPWIDKILEELERETTQSRFRHSLAINIITRNIIEHYAAGVPSWPGEQTKDRSNQNESHMLFVSPWRNLSIIGTFHSHYHGDPNSFILQEQDLLPIILEANSAYPGANLELDDIRFSHYGFLPEKSNPTSSEVKLVRKSRVVDHRSESGLSGLITILGVKYTTARHTAQKAIDLVFDNIGKTPPPCNTNHTQLHGGEMDHFSDYLSSTVKQDSDTLAPDTIDHWVRSYGTKYPHVKELLPESDDQSQLSLHSNPVITAQVLYAVREEMAIKLADVVLRRTGIGSIGRPDDTTLETIAKCMALELDWTAERIKLEIEEVKAIYRMHGVGKRAAESLENL